MGEVAVWSISVACRQYLTASGIDRSRSAIIAKLELPAAFPRDEILRRVWGPNVFVNGRSVDRCINTLRGKIEDDLSQPRWIQTVRETGYRFESDGP